MRYLLPILLITCLFSNSIKLSEKKLYPNFWFDSAGLLYTNLIVENISNKTIKYIKIKIEAVNRVGDKVYPDLGGKNVRFTGPFKPNKKNKFEFSSSTYYDAYDVIDGLNVNVVSITYMDNTTDVDINESIYLKNNLKEVNKSALIWGLVGGILLGLSF
tara:strand:+ start:42 stop:518 length:477 start_codon:yes stop_codon:yes gene_type:complete